MAREPRPYTPPTGPARLLDRTAISRGEALGLHARMLVEGFLSGDYRSPFRGFAIEFSQHREYAPGDDLRHLDWKVLGRTDKYHIKQYEQETNYVLHLILDGSASMRYGSGTVTKLEYGRRLAACLAYLVMHQRNAAALAIFDTEVRAFMPRTDNLAAVPGLLERLAAYEPSGQTAIGNVLHEMARQIKRRGIVAVISDCFDDEQGVLDGLRHLRFGGHDVALFHVMDSDELDFPFEGLYEFEGLEGEPILKTHPHEIRDSYLAEVKAFRDRIRAGCDRNLCHYVLANTRHPLHEVLTGYLAFRQRVSRR